MQSIVSAQGVTKTFGSVTAVSDLSFSIASGEIVALLGPNGAGKSTLLRMIVGLIKPDSGTISLAEAVDRKLRRGAIGYLPEERGLYQDMPVLRTLAYFGRLQGLPPRQATEVANGWLERFGLADRRSDKVKALSKGNQQKIQFAAAVLHKPALAILDEPFSGLDPLNQELFLDLARELRESGTTIIFSAHQMTLVERLADRVFLMSRGREVLHGTIGEIRKRWRTGDRLIVGVSPGVDVSFLETVAAVESVESSDASEMRLQLKPDVSISGLLTTLGERIDVRYIRSESVSLHEIYVKTVDPDRRPT